MKRCDYEPSLAEALADPLVQRLMAADRVDPRALARNLGALAEKLRARRG
jgi:hypothetical protein